MKRKESKFRKVVSILQVVVLCAIIIGCLLYLINEGIYSYNKAEELKEVKELQDEMQSEIEKIVSEDVSRNIIKKSNEWREEKNSDTGKDEILLEYQSLKKKYPDMYGRIWIDGITVKKMPFDFIVMYTPDNPNFYEDKNWEGDIVSTGTSVWIDGRTTKESKNTIIYGHKMKDGTMFGSLMNYKDKEFYKNHKYIHFDTLYEKGLYEIIAVSRIMYYDKKVQPDGSYNFYDHIELNSEEEFEQYICEAKKYLCFDVESTVQYGDELITLSTCNYEKNSNRLLIIAKRI